MRHCLRSLRYTRKRALQPSITRSVNTLKVDGLAVCRHGGLLERLGQCGMGVASARDILAGRTVLESEGSLGNHLTGVGLARFHF